MKVVSSFLRQTSLNSKFFLENLLRAEKKSSKKQVGESQPLLSNDIINIFKNKTDEQILPITEYPPWLLSLIIPGQPLEVIATAWEQDDELLKPSGEEMGRIIKLQRKRIIKNNNYVSALKNRDLMKPVQPVYAKDIYHRSKKEDEERAKKKKAKSKKQQLEQTTIKQDLKALATKEFQDDN